MYIYTIHLHSQPYIGIYNYTLYKIPKHFVHKMALYIKMNGSVHINGSVYINGSVSDCIFFVGKIIIINLLIFQCILKIKVDVSHTLYMYTHIVCIHM